MLHCHCEPLRLRRARSNLIDGLLRRSRPRNDSGLKSYTVELLTHRADIFFQRRFKLSSLGHSLGLTGGLDGGLYIFQPISGDEHDDGLVTSTMPRWSALTSPA